jgi:hypothetical protein
MKNKLTHANSLGSARTASAAKARAKQSDVSRPDEVQLAMFDLSPSPALEVPAEQEPAKRVPADPQKAKQRVMSVNPSLISLHPAFNIDEAALEKRYAKEIAGIIEALRRGGEQVPWDVCEAPEPGQFHLLGRPPLLLAARRFRAENATFRVPVILRETFDAAAFYRAMTATLRRPSDWERYAVASYHVQQAGSARAAMAMLGLDLVKDESAFSRLMSIGKLVDTISSIDPFTVTAASAARVMALRTSPAAVRAMDAHIEAETISGENLDARKLLPRLIAAVDPSAVAPEMTKLDGPESGWTFGRAGAEPFALVRQQVGDRWSIKLLRGMNAASWRAFGKAMATLTS